MCGPAARLRAPPRAPSPMRGAASQTPLAMARRRLDHAFHRATGPSCSSMRWAQSIRRYQAALMGATVSEGPHRPVPSQAVTEAALVAQVGQRGAPRTPKRIPRCYSTSTRSSPLNRWVTNP